MKSNLKKYIQEGIIIVFSILFALFIDKSFEAYQRNKKKNIAKESILKELYQNQSILATWKEKHSKIRDSISAVIEGQADSIKMELKKYDYLNLGILTENQSLINAILTNTAWESAKTTGIITEFEYETIQKLTHVYSMQEPLTERTLMNILDYYFDTDSHDIKNLEKSLTQFQLRFSELTGQEELMLTLYSNAIKQISN
ncbi:MAG: hypothetical protein AAF696_30040 [Bacteroidota bacterium]